MSGVTPPPADASRSEVAENPYEPRTNASVPEPRHHDLTQKLIGPHRFPDNEALHDGSSDSLPQPHRRPTSTRPDPGPSLQTNFGREGKSSRNGPPTPRVPSTARANAGSAKLGTFSGVFVPTSLNVLSILMFLRFGFILGQTGLLGMMAMLIVSYLINLITTLSVSAIATNGTVRGGGAYYLISRSLGPEFGGSIGVVFYLGVVFNTGMNAVGLIDCLTQNFGAESGVWYHVLPDGFWWRYLWATVVLLSCTAICLAGSGIFSRASNGLLAVVLLATFSIPLSAVVRTPFESRSLGVQFTGLSLDTFRGNLFPALTKGAAGSQIKGRENFQDLFGVLFPATGGIFAGASMSGDLKHPSKAIPKGTLAGLALTFVTYTIVILAMAATITRPSFYRDVNVIQDTSISEGLILLGEFATTFFSALMGVIGSAKLLQALARDNLLPGLAIFGHGSAKSDEPTYAIFVTYLVAQVTMLLDINQIASFVTMTYLMTFLVTNLACFLLKIGSAPNFRPSFRYFNSQTAALGTIVCGASMFFVDGLYATGCVGILVIVFLLIHYTTPPKSWGDVSQSLIYHQVRKYLLRLRQEHVKFWRPQILLLINDPRRQYKLIQFCNSMKKGALYILGHVIVSPDFGEAVPEARRQQAAWTRYIDVSKVKAFVNISISPVFEWGTRNIVLSSGLGGMRPNIAVMGFFNLDEARQAQPLVDLADPSQPLTPSKPAEEEGDGKPDGLLPTDGCRREGALRPSSYVTVLEDLLLRLQINVAIARGFSNLEIPDSKGDSQQKTIDLWPIQMSAEISGDGGSETNILTTNFDTYTLILQLGCILNTVPSWQKAYRLRVAVFVEYESDVEEERGRVKALLDNLRIQAEILVFWLASGELKTYEIVVNGTVPVDGATTEAEVDEILKDEEWWQEMQRLRGKREETSASQYLAEVEGLVASPMWPGPSTQEAVREDGSPRSTRPGRIHGLKKMFRAPGRRASSFGLISKLGVSLGMRTHRLDPNLVDRHVSHASASEDSDSSDEEPDEIESEAVTEGDSLDDDYRSDGESERRSMPPPSAKSGERSTTSDRGGEQASLLKGPDPSTSSQASSRINPPRIPLYRQSSKFSSKPVPMTRVSAEDGAGPSIMFADTPTTTEAPPFPPSGGAPDEEPSGNDGSSDTPEARRSRQGTYPSRAEASGLKSGIPARGSASASGYPSQSAVALSFNDLPCRAQHLILNELLRAHSGGAAVIFTTLPSPLEGTGRSDADSLHYLADLDLLCAGLPPTLLVHSNSMTVTTNL